MSLEKITKRFGKTYDRVTKYTKQKSEQQTEMFEAFTQELAKDALAKKVVKIPWATSEEEALSEAARLHGGWIAKEAKLVNLTFADAEPDITWQVQLEEDPSLKAFLYVNADDKRVYGRIRTNGSPALDSERLKETDPALYDQVTYVPTPEWAVVLFADMMGLRISLEKAREDLQFYLQDEEREFYDLEDLPEDLMAAIQPYMFVTAPTVKLKSPRDAKDDELEGDFDEESGT